VTIRKLRFFADFDKEEAWLNQMVSQGQLLVRARFPYVFEPVDPGSATVRVDYRPSMSPSDFEDYVRLFEDAGWRHLDGSRRGGPQYFASYSTDADADIFSDSTSKAQRYQRSIATYGMVLLPLLIVFFVPLSRGDLWPFTGGSPSDWYLTPGLWRLQGAEFWRAFLFESVFVVFRAGAPLLLLALCLGGAVLAAYQYVLYRRKTAHAG
jgi:hypothetical protein